MGRFNLPYFPLYQHLRLVAEGCGGHRYGPRLNAPVDLLGRAFPSSFSKILAMED